MSKNNVKNRLGHFVECGRCIAQHIRSDSPCEVSLNYSYCPHFLHINAVNDFLFMCLCNKEIVEKFLIEKALDELSAD